MKKHLLLFFLTALMAVPAMADVVYEPLIVDSGFNRDVIAERTPVSVQFAKSYLIADTTINYWSMATKSVIRTVNTNSGLFTQDQLDFSAETGWPDDYRDTIKCIEDAKDVPLYKDVFFLMAPYDKKQVLTIRPVGGTTSYDPSGYSPGIQNGEGTLKFKKVGCYDRVFFLIAAAKENGAKDPREVKTIVYYTNGDTTQAKFQFGGLSGAVGHNVRRINIFEYQYKKATLDKNNAFAMVFDMPVNPQKLISKIEFKNELVGTAVMIFAVTGRTADMEVPEAEEMTVSNIEQNSFEACWEAITDAASYRLDVATDIDFQHILEDYNNKVIAGEQTCQEVVELVANNDYYWRVRSVDSEGGQSASSAPRRVRTAAPAETPAPATRENDSDIEADLAEWLNADMASIDIHRTLYRDGFFNTICLPFDLNAAGIAASPLAGCDLFEYVSATQNGTQLDIVMQQTDHIDAGVPYLIRWANTSDIIPSPLTFHGVRIKRNTGLTIGDPDDIRFVGHIGQKKIPFNDQNNLFVGENNVLYWPDETDSKMKGFRAYFAIPSTTPSGMPIRRGTPARIVYQRENTPTFIDASLKNSDDCISIKSLENGQMVIIRNGVKYDTLGKRL